EAHRQLFHAAAARAIGSEAGVTGNTGDRTDIHDAAVLARDHVSRHGLGNEERAAEIGLEHEIPIIPRDLERRLADIAPGIVDEDVDPSIVRGGSIRHPANALLVANVQRERKDAAAERGDFLLEVRERRRIAAGDDEIRARAGKRASEVLAETAA